MTTVSLVLPFYNEEANVRRVVSALLAAGRQSEWEVDLVCVQNGSLDQTPQLLQALAAENPDVSIVKVPVNRGYGHGVCEGLRQAGGEVVGYLDGDGQISPDDVFQTLAGMRTHRAAKAIRVERQDGWQRRGISWCYNQLLRVLFAVLFRVHSRDANAKPKFLRRSDLELLKLVSDDWFIDAEIMIKSAALGITWAEHPVRFLRRQGGRSNVRLGTIYEFLANLLRWRFKGLYSAWLTPTLSQADRCTTGQRQHG